MVSPRRSQLVSPSKQRAMSSTTRPHLPRPGGPRRHASRAPRAAEPLSTPSGSVPTPQAGDRLAPLIQDPGHLCSDEPTTGLRPADPGRVIDILDRLVDAGAQSWSSSTASTSSIEPTESSTSAPTPVTASVRISWKLELSSRDVTPLKDQSRDFSIQLVEGLGAASLLNVHHRGERRLVSCLRVGPVTLSAEIRGVLLL